MPKDYIKLLRGLVKVQDLCVIWKKIILVLISSSVYFMEGFSGMANMKFCRNSSEFTQIVKNGI